MHVPDVKRRKLEPKSKKCILVGYSHRQKGYKCYNPHTKQVRVSRDVEFSESTSWYSLPTPTPEANPILEYEASGPETIWAKEEELGTLHREGEEQDVEI